MLATWQGDLDTALGQLNESFAIWQRVEDELQLATAFMGIGVTLINMGQDSAAQPKLDEARVLFEEQRLPYWHATVLVHLANAALGLGHPDQARAWLEQALAQIRTIGESWLLSFALNNFGEVARTQGQYDRARGYYEESEALLRRSGDKGDLARLVHTLGYVAMHEGDYTKAETQFRESLAMFRQLGNRRGIAECLAALAGLEARQGHPRWGATMLGAAETLLQATGGAWWPADRVEVNPNREMIRAALDAAEFDAAMEKGRAMNLDQALLFAEGCSRGTP
jgi:tetratricopeptide (TPR) repeat protein